MSNAIDELIRALVDNMRGAEDDWQSFAMVLDFDGERFSGTHGYSYGPGAVISAVASRPSAVGPHVDAYLADVTFEDADAARWKVTPANIDRMGEALRPSF
ncbi:MAG: hypothetical protein ABS63_01010 [Microbacterium sp. SCN 70-27]|uniref:hypothetical protein n=1 Tax=unclassified Microbacterium TaxID=2609290 RepID=UPI00086B1B63|nr:MULTISPECIES: hypothetical protein [unclassified Microbacterium]MBN9225298.1 hypothetical protein [Microbacterium sp.]ODT29081.1 MAG: hypothetical protein ABS63_01010 [Microbacterium sp. SCN 70-27]